MHIELSNSWDMQGIHIWFISHIYNIHLFQNEELQDFLMTVWCSCLHPLFQQIQHFLWSWPALKMTGKLLISSGLSVLCALHDSGLGERDTQSFPSQVLSRARKTWPFPGSRSFLNFSLWLGYCQVATHVIYGIVCPQQVVCLGQHRRP